MDRHDDHRRRRRRAPAGTNGAGGRLMTIEIWVSSSGASIDASTTSTQHLAGERQEQHAAGDHLDRVEPVAEAGGDAEVAAAAADRPEQVGVRGLAEPSRARRRPSRGRPRAGCRWSCRACGRASRCRRPASGRRGRPTACRRTGSRCRSACAAVVYSPAVAPPWAVPVQRIGSMSTALHRAQVDAAGRRPSCESPATLWPPLATAMSRPSSRAVRTARATLERRRRGGRCAAGRLSNASVVGRAARLVRRVAGDDDLAADRVAQGAQSRRRASGLGRGGGGRGGGRRGAPASGWRSSGSGLLSESLEEDEDDGAMLRVRAAAHATGTPMASPRGRGARGA